MNGLKTVVLLGAGATRGALKGFHMGGTTVIVPINADFLPVAQRFASAKGKKSLRDKVVRLKNFIYNELGERKSRTPPMEEIFSILYSSKDFMEIYKKKKGRKAAYLREIQDFFGLLGAIFREVETYAYQQQKTNFYKNLAKLVEDGDTIISLNYDTLMDKALVEQGWNPKRGYGADFNHKLRAFQNTKKSNRFKDLVLLKLHGSFNWFVRKKQREDLDVLFRKKPSLVINPAKFGWNEKKGYLRQIIPPIYGKFFAHNFWKDLWTLAFDRLVSCDCLIVIGCSLAETDFHLRAFLGRAKVIRRKAKRPFKRVLVVDPDKKQQPQKRFKLILMGCKLKFESLSTFERFVKQYEKSLKNNNSKGESVYVR